MLHRRRRKRACLQTSKAAISSVEEQKDKLPPQQAAKTRKKTICLRETQQLQPCESRWDEPGRKEAVATGRRASPLQLAGLQPQPRFPRQPSVRTPSGPLPGAPPLDSLAVRHRPRGGGTAEPTQEAGTFFTRDGDPNFSPPSPAAERGAVLTLGCPRGCPSPPRRPPCLAAASPAHRSRRHSLLNAPLPSDGSLPLPVQIRDQGVCAQAEIPSLLSIPSAQHHPVPRSPSFPHLSITLSPPRHPSPPQHRRPEEPRSGPRSRRRPQQSAATGGVRGAPPAPSPSWRASPATRH